MVVGAEVRVMQWGCRSRASAELQAWQLHPRVPPCDARSCWALARVGRLQQLQ